MLLSQEKLKLVIRLAFGDDCKTGLSGPSIEGSLLFIASMSKIDGRVLFCQRVLVFLQFVASSY